jgi:hypothetical protein
MSIYDAVMQARGFRRDAEPQAKPLGRAAAIGWKDGRQVAVPMPDPNQPGYGPAMDRFQNWRGYASPLGGVSPAPWGIAPKVGEAALKPEYRRKRKWGCTYG